MKKFVMVTVFLFAFLFMNVNVNAAEIQIDKKVVKANDEVVVTIDLDGYDSAKIKYDKNIFENLNSKSLDLEDVTYDKDSKTFSLTKGDDTTIQVILKVKDDIKVGKTKIDVNYIKDDSVVSSSKTLTVNGTSEEAGFFTGIKADAPYIPVILIVLAVLIVAGAIYLYNRQTDEDKQKVIAVISTILVAIILIFAVMILGSNTKDKENTKNTDEYLIELEDDSDAVTESEDMTSTDEISAAVSERAYSRTFKVQTLNNKGAYVSPQEIAYNVKLNNVITSEDIVQKGDNVIITFTVNITPYTDIKAVEINGKTYPVTKVGNKYQVVVKAFNKYGNGDYIVTGVVLANGTKIKVQPQSTTVYVLKIEPSIENIKIDGKEETPVLTFDVKDPDNAFVSGKVEMTGTTEPAKISLLTINNLNNGLALTSNAITILDKTDVHVGKNTYELPGLTEGMNYDLKITLNYDLDEDKTDNEYSGQVNQEENAQTFEREYNFELKNPKLPEKIDDSTSLTFSFENGAFAYTDIKSINIDGKNYEVTKDEATGVYTLTSPTEIEKCSEKGKCHFTINSVTFTMESGEEKTVDVNQNVDYVYYKNEPTSDAFNPSLNDNNLTGNFNINDDDVAVTGAKVVLEKDGKKYSYPLTENELRNSTINQTVKLDEAGDYKITLVATYDLGDGKILEKELKSSTVHQNIVANVEKVTGNENLVNRDTEIELTYTISSNTKEDITSMTINGTEVTGDKLIKQSDGVYTVKVTPTYEKDLTEEITVTKITYQSEAVELNHKTSVKVFKLEPTIGEDFSVSYDQANLTKTNLTITDTEGAVNGGELKVEGPDGTKTIPLSAEELNAFVTGTPKALELNKAGEYKVTLTIKYDLGDGKEKTKSQSSSNKISKNIVPVIEKVEADTELVTRGQTVGLTYTITDNTDKEISKIKVNNELLEAKEVDGKYVVTAKVPEEGGANPRTFTATEIVYGKETVEETVTVQESKTISLNVLKAKPQIGTLTTSAAGGLISGEFNFTDDEGAVVGAKYQINGGEEKKIEFNPEDKQGTFTDDVERPAESYNVKVTLIYDLGNGRQESDSEMVMESTVEVAIDAIIETVTPEKEYINKNDNIVLIYKIDSNDETDLNSITINGEKYQAPSLEKQDDGTYKVTITGKSADYGSKEFKATELGYGDKPFTLKESPSNTANVTVLKEKPTFGEFSASYDKNTLTGSLTDITDVDSAIMGATYKIDSIECADCTLDRALLMTKSFTKEIEVAQAGEYNVTLTVTYDLGDGVKTKEFKTKFTRKIEVSSISSTETERTAEKNSQITIKYTINDNTDKKVKQIKIGEDYYDAKETDNPDIYTVTLNGESTPGDKTYTASEVVYSESEKIAVQNETNVYILKTKPSINSYTINDTTLTVNLTDLDSTRTSLTVKFDDGNENTIETNQIDIQSLVTNGQHKVTITLNYDRDGEELDVADKSVTKVYENVNIITEYNPTVSNLELKQFTDNNKILLEFESTNTAGLEVTKAKIGGKTYAVNKGSDNKYSVTIDKPKERTELSISELTFSNDISRSVTSNIVLVNKNKPTAEVTAEVVDKNKVKATITKKTDDDNTIKEGKYSAVLKKVGDDETTEVETIKITDNNPITFTEPMDGGTLYQVEVVADYDLVDGNTYENVTIGTSNHVVIDAEVKLVSSTLPVNESFPGNKEFSIKYNFESNVKLGSDLKSVKVHTEEYPTTEGTGEDDKYTQVGLGEIADTSYNAKCDEPTKEGGTYKTSCRVNYVIPNKSSVIKVKAVSFNYLDNEKDGVDVTDTEQLVDVTYWAPAISYRTVNDYDQREVKFTFSIQDPSMLQQFPDGTYLKFSYGSSTVEDKITEIQPGQEYTITFKNVPQDYSKGVRLEVSAYYDKYHGNIVNKESNRVKEIKIVAGIHYFNRQDDVSLNDLKIVDEHGGDIDNDNVPHGEQIKLSFAANGEPADHPGFKTDRVTISTTDKTNRNYPSTYAVTEQDGVYTTNDFLKPLNAMEQTLTITYVYDDGTSIQTTKNNTITITVKASGPDPIANTIKKEVTSLKAREKETDAAVSIKTPSSDETSDEESDEIKTSQEKTTDNVVAKEEDVNNEPVIDESTDDNDNSDEMKEEDSEVQVTETDLEETDDLEVSDTNKTEEVETLNI